jgi:two-component system LytT family response regulator
MLKALIVNDNSECRQLISHFLNKKQDVEIIASTDNILEGKSILESNIIDILFLDIMVGNSMGFELLNYFQAISFKVVFTTIDEPFALRAIRYANFDFIIKPITECDFERVFKNVRKKQTPLVIKHKLEYFSGSTEPNRQCPKLALTTSRNEIELIDVETIIYCEAEGFYTKFHLENQSDLLVCKNLKEYEKLLPKNFIRIHKSYLVNKNKIKKIIRSDGGYIVMDNKQMLPIGQKKEYFINYLIN